MPVHLVIVSAVGDDLDDVMAVLQMSTDMLKLSPDVEIETLDTGQIAATAAYVHDEEEEKEETDVQDFEQ